MASVHSTCFVGLYACMCMCACKHVSHLDAAQVSNLWSHIISQGNMCHFIRDKENKKEGARSHEDKTPVVRGRVLVCWSILHVEAQQEGHWQCECALRGGSIEGSSEDAWVSFVSLTSSCKQRFKEERRDCRTHNVRPCSGKAFETPLHGEPDRKQNVFEPRSLAPLRV